MENLVTPFGDWSGRSVFITGHTGFKGGWLSWWLQSLGARLHGYSLAAPTQPSLFDVARVSQAFETSMVADVRDAGRLRGAMALAQPEVVFHLAAQPLVRASYLDPLETFSTNVMGTANLLDAVQHCESVRAVVVVTTDKCYQEQAWPWPYREADTLGGHDPYAASKACAELVTASYRDAFRWTERGLGVATARAGNVIGGGDWTPERLVPDLLQAISQGQAAPIRNPSAVRPWQHVLEPLAGYLILAERLLADPAHFSGAWNFGPETMQDHPVSDVLARLQALAKGSIVPVLPTDFMPSSTADLHEARYLRIDASKARRQLGWIGRLDLDAALHLTWQWHSAWREGRDMKACTQDQIKVYLSAGRQTKGTKQDTNEYT